MNRVLVVLLKTLGIILCSFISALILPGIVAEGGGVFYEDGVVSKLPQAAARSLARYRGDLRNYERQIDGLDSYLIENPSARTPEALAIREALNAKLRQEPPLTPVAFFPNSQTFTWPILYAALGVIVLIFRPRLKAPRSQSRLPILICGLAIFVFYDWPLWVRNFVLSNRGRRVYAYTNADIYWPSFVMQEITILIFCMLLAALWCHWSNFFIQRQLELQEELRHDRSAVEIFLDSNTTDRLSATFRQWQACSLLLVAGFLFATNFYWTIEVNSADSRYQASAIAIHVLWGLSWIVLSAPLFATWRHWERIKFAALATLISQGRPEETAALGAILSETRPLNSVAVLVSTLGSVASFLFPIVKVAVLR